VPLPTLPSFLRTRAAVVAAVAVSIVLAVVIGLIAGGSGGDDTTAAGPVDPPTPTPTAPPEPTPTPVPSPTPIDFSLAPITAPTPEPTPFRVEAAVAERFPQRWRPIARPGAAAEAGPTADWPTGGVLGSLVGGSRWEYRGILGRLRPGDEVVPALARPPRTAAGTEPLTGLPDKRSPQRRAIVVKIDNVPAARPQTAINEADIVVEELVEGGMTRLAAVFHSARPEAIGPVRSARSTDIGIAASYRRPVFANSGANGIFSSLVARAPLIDRGNQVFGGYWRVGGRPAPHNMFTSSSRLLDSVEDREGPPPAQFAYRAEGDGPHPEARRASRIRLVFRTGSSPRIEYRWDADLGGWQRFNDGVAHTDSDGRPVAPENVIVWFTPYIDSGLTDKWGEVLYEGVSVGRGDALIFTDGRVVAARWNRPTLRSPATFTDADGEHVALTPGRTWVAMVAPGGATWR
jgi:hypothetical protein